jgi:hypothetical protein
MAGSGKAGQREWRERRGFLLVDLWEFVGADLPQEFAKEEGWERLWHGAHFRGHDQPKLWLTPATALRGLSRVVSGQWPHGGQVNVPHLLKWNSREAAVTPRLQEP